MAAILFGFPMVWFWNGWDHSYNYCHDQLFQNQTIGNLNFKMFGIPMCAVLKPPLNTNLQVWQQLIECVQNLSRIAMLENFDVAMLSSISSPPQVQAGFLTYFFDTFWC